MNRPAVSLIPGPSSPPDQFFPLSLFFTSPGFLSRVRPWIRLIARKRLSLFLTHRIWTESQETMPVFPIPTDSRLCLPFPSFISMSFCAILIPQVLDPALSHRPPLKTRIGNSWWSKLNRQTDAVYQRIPLLHEMGMISGSFRSAD